MELRTEEGLLYNDDIDTKKDLKIYIDDIDNSFKYSVIKAGDIYGNINDPQYGLFFTLIPKAKIIAIFYNDRGGIRVINSVYNKYIESNYNFL